VEADEPLKNVVGIMEYLDYERLRPGSHALKQDILIPVAMPLL
jgi:hypothetical protein